ncbi:MAG: M42 family peptidase [Thermoprotei archaeon]|nr:MAG: M42 family peptidase [Thermoprotei archaeon]
MVKFIYFTNENETMPEYALLRQLCSAPGPPGFEDKVAELIISELDRLGFEYEADSIGNLYVELGGGRPLTLLSAHMDEIGFMVTHVTDEGFLKVTNLGGVNPGTAIGNLVTVLTHEGGVYGVVGATPPHLLKNGRKELTIDDLFVDIGASSREEAHALGVDRGAPIVFRSYFISEGGSVIGKALDDRVGCYVLLKALEKAEEPEHGKIVVAFTVQEEVGGRGASTLAHRFKPDIGISIEGTIANDTPGTPSEKIVTKAGEGAAIRLMDATIIAQRKLVDYIVELAKRENIKFQFQISPKSGTDAKWYIQLGASSAGISVPVRYIHSSYSLAFKKDIEAVINLLKVVIEDNFRKLEIVKY